MTGLRYPCVACASRRHDVLRASPAAPRPEPEHDVDDPAGDDW